MVGHACITVDPPLSFVVLFDSMKTSSIVDGEESFSRDFRGELSELQFLKQTKPSGQHDKKTTVGSCQTPCEKLLDMPSQWTFHTFPRAIERSLRALKLSSLCFINNLECIFQRARARNRNMRDHGIMHHDVRTCKTSNLGWRCAKSSPRTISQSSEPTVSTCTKHSLH